MAIGDAIAQHLGTGTEVRQPASGVEEQITCIIKPGTTDAPTTSDGSEFLDIMVGANRTDVQNASAVNIQQPVFNIAMMITNSMFIRKAGTTNNVYIGGVQTNA